MPFFENVWMTLTSALLPFCVGHLMIVLVLSQCSRFVSSLGVVFHSCSQESCDDSSCYDDMSIPNLHCQLIEMFGSLLNRPIIRNSFDSKLPTLISMCGQELDEVKLIFDRYVLVYQQAWY